ncbi:MAG: SLBB domain-containing protein [Bacteroidota bacterium]
MKRIFGIFLLMILVCSTDLYAQNVPIDEATIRRELERRGLKEEDVRQKLVEKGIDINNIDASQLPMLEETLEEIVKELEEENAEAVQKTTEQVLEKEIKEVAKDAVEEINESVKDGANLEKAITEELIEAANEIIPPSKIYGQQLFRDKSLKVFNSSSDNRPPDSYVLGPGDKLNITIWGISQEDVTHEINEGGYITPSGMQRITLKGLTFGQAKTLLRRRFAQYYQFRPEEFEVNINQLRNITVNVYGEVFNPGGFNLSARNTAFNALVAAGGPSKIGSIRNIRLISTDGTVKNIDVYRFMMDPSIQEEYYLTNNDIIHVGVFKKRVSLEGAVKRPLRYELLDDEDLVQLIDYAGGFRSNAYQGNIQVKRYIDDEEKIFDLNWNDLKANKGDFTLLNGDLVTVLEIPKAYENFAEISGAVRLEGKYELQNGMRVSDLIARGGLENFARRDIAFLIRIREDGSIKYEKLNIDVILNDPNNALNYPLQSRDRLRILSQTTYTDQESIEVAGEVRRPGPLVYDPEQSIRVADAILLTGGIKPEATDFAYIHRRNPVDGKEKEYIRINLVAALSNASSPDNMILQAQDLLQVYSKQTFINRSVVRVAGSVKNPGEFPFDESLDLSDVLTLAGGLSLEAASNRIEVFRVQIVKNEPTQIVVATLDINDDFTVQGNDFELQPFDQVMVRAVPDFELQRLVTIQGEVKYPGPYPIINPNEKLSSLLQRAGGLSLEAFPAGATLVRESVQGVVVLSLDEVIENSGAVSNIILRKGDVITIPKRKDLVSIEVRNSKALELYPDKMLRAGKINVPYEKGKNAKYYIDTYAGGIGENGRKSLVAVEHPNGEINRTTGFLFFKNYPDVREGSTISIGAKPPKVKEKDSGERKKEPTDWGKVIANSIAQATAVFSLVILVQRLD